MRGAVSLIGVVGSCVWSLLRRQQRRRRRTRPSPSRRLSASSATGQPTATRRRPARSATSSPSPRNPSRMGPSATPCSSSSPTALVTMSAMRSTPSSATLQEGIDRHPDHRRRRLQPVHQGRRRLVGFQGCDDCRRHEEGQEDGGEGHLLARHLHHRQLLAVRCEAGDGEDRSAMQINSALAFPRISTM